MSPLKRDFLFVGCGNGHDWQHVGGRNAGCGDDCCCSVPVYRCARCGDYDYGNNQEAEEILGNCEHAKEIADECGNDRVQDAGPGTADRERLDPVNP